jgi:hypothetical protein
MGAARCMTSVRGFLDDRLPLERLQELHPTAFFDCPGTGVNTGESIYDKKKVWIRLSDQGEAPDRDVDAGPIPEPRITIEGTSAF